MFYAQLEKLCNERGEKITPLVKKLNISTGSTGNWQRGAIPNGETLIKFAEYFGVTTDYLLGREKSEAKKEKEKKMNELRFWENSIPNILKALRAY